MSPRRARATITAALIAVLVGAVSFLAHPQDPLDGVALWAVQVGTSMTGYTPVFGRQVKFVLVEGQAGGRGLGDGLIVEVLVGLLALAAALGVVIINAGRSSGEHEHPAQD